MCETVERYAEKRALEATVKAFLKMMNNKEDIVSNVKELYPQYTDSEIISKVNELWPKSN